MGPVPSRYVAKRDYIGTSAGWNSQNVWSSVSAQILLAVVKIMFYDDMH